MKLIINGFTDPIHYSIPLDLLKKFKVSCCHMISGDFKIGLPSSVEATYYDMAKLSLGEYCVDWNNVQPLDEELIDSMSSCETVVLRMMDRHLYVPFYNDRKRLYLKHLRYWNHILSKSKIDLFLSCSPPHDVYDYIIYCLCKIKKIPTIFLYPILYSDVILMMDDWEKISSGIINKYNRLLNYYKSISEEKIKLTGEINKDFKYQKSGDRTPPRLVAIKHSLTIKDHLKATVSRVKRYVFLIKHPMVLLDRIFFFLRRSLTKGYLSNFYDENTVEPDIKTKFIYFPLHMQPEATTSPFAGAYVDQILAVQMIASKLPKNFYIYVKEHPSQTDYCRDVEFYKELLEIPQVRLIPREYNTFDLINNSIAVATATGTAGWEGLFRKKPVLLFGHCFYQYIKGVFMIRTNNDCRKALNKIINESFKPKTKDIKIYLKVLEEYTIEGNLDLVYHTISHLEDNISNNNIIDKLTKKIKATILST